MKKKTFRIGLVFTLILVLVSVLIVSRLDSNPVASELLIPEKTLVEKQSEVTQVISSAMSEEMIIYLDPYEISPLSALITFITPKETAVTVTVKGQKGSPDLKQTFDAALYQTLPVYGLYANSLNEVLVEYDDVSTTLTIQTEPLPSDFTTPTKTYVNETYSEMVGDDFYFLTPASTGYTSGFDKQGNVRWYLTEKLVWEIRTLKNGNLLLSNETLINPPYYTTGLYEMDMLGNIKKEYLLPGGYHHDVAELPNGNLLVASNEFEFGTVEDSFVEVNRENGSIIRSVNLRDILEVEGGRSENWTDYDWFHNNSIWYDEPTNSITLSGRHQDLVVNLDYETLGINYLVGNPEGYSDGYQDYFLKPEGDLEWQYAQHAAKILPNGNLFLFDNGINRSKNPEAFINANDNYSRGVIYDINQDAMTIKQVYQYGKERGSHYFSSYISDVDYLNDDHYLIHSGGVAFNNEDVLNQPPGLTEFTALKSYTSEVYNDELIFELELDNNYYRAEKMPIYSSSRQLEFDDAIVLGSLPYTPPTDEYLSFFPNVVNDPSLLEAYNISINHDGRRIEIKGDFKKEDEVSFILYSKFKMREYKVRVSERPYTAMCIVIFDDKTQSVTQYITDGYDLSGEYTILININGTLYATNKRVMY